MSHLTNPQVHRIVQLSATLCQENRIRCADQLINLHNQREALAVQRQKRTDRRLAEIAELTALCESMGLQTVPEY